MDFSLTESQQEIARLAGQLLDEGKADPWKELARAGLLALSLPPELGGDGLGVLDTAVLLAEIGRRAAPVPALATLMTGVLPVVRWGDDEPAAGAAAGRRRGRADPHRRPPRAVGPDAPGPGRHGHRGHRVCGTKVGVPYCAQAGRVLLPVSFASARDGTRGDRRRHRRPGGARGGVTRTPAAAGGPEYTLRLDRVPVEHVLGGGRLPDGPVPAGRGGRVLPGRRRLVRGARADQGPRRRQAAVRPAAGRLPGGRPAGRRRLHRVAHPAPGHACRRAGGSTRARTRPATSPWRDYGARRRHHGPFGPVITCTAGRGWTSPIPCTTSRR